MEMYGFGMELKMMMPSHINVEKKHLHLLPRYIYIQ